jgi:hypothetical protein
MKIEKYTMTMVCSEWSGGVLGHGPCLPGTDSDL